ncbi:MAG: SsrA-binding protein SmpB [bacterium]
MGKTVTKNRKAFHNYDFEEFYEAGLALEGTEVKALREGKAHLKDSYAVVSGGELELLGAYIGHYGNAPANQQHDPERTRKLLLKKREIKELIGKLSREGYTLVPTQIYFNNRGWAKVQLGLGKGLKKYDKREKKKKREQERRLRQQYSARIR